MEIRSEWEFDCEPRHVWPHFLRAKMDDTRPILFNLGIPKPLSCKVLEGAPYVGATRQCTTDRGTINQNIEVLEQNQRLRYRMKESTVWCRDWVDYLEDTFALTPLPNGRTRVERITRFSAQGRFAALKTLGMWVSLKQAHAYASRNWRRLAYEMKRQEEGRGLEEGSKGVGQIGEYAT